MREINSLKNFFISEEAESKESITHPPSDTKKADIRPLADKDASAENRYFSSTPGTSPESQQEFTHPQGRRTPGRTGRTGRRNRREIKL